MKLPMATSTLAICVASAIAASAAFGRLAARSGPTPEPVAANDAAFAQFQQGRQLARLGRHSEALAALNLAFEGAPQYPITLIHIAHARYNLNQFADAVRAYSEFIARRPGAANAHWGRAQALNALGDHHAAIADADAALAIDARLSGALYQRAFAFRRLGDSAAAFRDVLAALAIDPDEECLKALLRELQMEETERECAPAIAQSPLPKRVAGLLASLRN